MTLSPSIPNTSLPHDSGPPLSQDESSVSKHQTIPIPPAIIAVMGTTGSGKTTFINLASGSKRPLPTGSQSRLAEVQLSDEFTVDGRTVTLIDTPGFEFASGADDVLKMITVFLATVYGEGSKLAGIIYIHRICDGGMTGIAGRNFGTFSKLCGEMSTLKNVVLVTNMWSTTPHKVGEAREKEFPNNIFKLALGKGAQMVRHHDTVQSAHDIIRMITKNHPVTLPIQGELVDRCEGPVCETIGRELNGQARRRQDELVDLNRRLQEATKASAADRARLEQEVKERSRTEAEYQRKLADLTRRLHGDSETSTSVAHRASSEQEMKKPQDRITTAVTMPPDMPPRRAPPLPPRDKASTDGDQSTVRIAVMGATGSGKSTFINLASGSNLRVGMGLESCTAEVQLSDEFTFDSSKVVLIDTPGFDDTSKSDTEILRIIAAFLATTYEKGLKFTGVIYIHRISDRRFTGVAGRNFNMFLKLCGESALKNVVIVTNMWNEDPQDVNEAREKELRDKFFKPALGDRGAQMVRHLNTVESARDIMRKIVKNDPVVLQIQRELVDEGKDLGDTAAGSAVNRELSEQLRRHLDELKGVQEEMARALEEKDEETRMELKEETRRLNEEIGRIKKDEREMAMKYAAEKRRIAARMMAMEEARRGRGRA